MNEGWRRGYRRPGREREYCNQDGVADIIISHGGFSLNHSAARTTRALDAFFLKRSPLLEGHDFRRLTV
jgi:hypothetical protein